MTERRTTPAAGLDCPQTHPIWDAPAIPTSPAVVVSRLQPHATHARPLSRAHQNAHQSRRETCPRRTAERLLLISPHQDHVVAAPLGVARAAAELCRDGPGSVRQGHKPGRHLRRPRRDRARRCPRVVAGPAEPAGRPSLSRRAERRHDVPNQPTRGLKDVRSGPRFLEITTFDLMRRCFARSIANRGDQPLSNLSGVLDPDLDRVRQSPPLAGC
jgi:hypothetical protein